MYGFPILMTLALGIAFRNQPVEQIAVDVVAGPAAEATARSALPSRTSPERFKTRVLLGSGSGDAAAHRPDRSGRRAERCRRTQPACRATNIASTPRGRRACWRGARSTINCSAPRGGATWPK